MKMIQRWVSIFLSTVILSTLVACSAADDTGQSKLGTTQEPVNGVQELFGSSLFLGDSIIGGLTNEDLLPGANVMGGLGATVQSTLGNVEEITSRKPSYVFLSLGQNDLGEPREEAKKTFIQQYTHLVDRIRELLPTARVYVLSIPPVDEEAVKQEPRDASITDYNQALDQLADEMKVDYVDLSTLFAANKIRYADNGVHFKPDFYPLLLDYLMEFVK